MASWSPALLLVEVLCSLFYSGWITTMMGALAGVVLIQLQHSLTRREQERAERAAAMLRQREWSGLEVEVEGGERRYRNNLLTKRAHI